MKTQFGIHTRGGVITERDADYATIRLRIPAGVLSAAQLRGIAEIAEKYGDGGVHLTMRQTIELPHVDPSLLEDIAAVLGENGTPLGAERDEVVNVMACPGLERCKYANVETIELAKRIDHLVFGKEMPVKVRISIAGCTYACGSPQLNEIGIVGRIRPLRIPGLCTGCGTCVEYCRNCAIAIRDGISVLDESKCLQCGICIYSCPFHLLKSEYPHYQILVGGRRGMEPRIGRELINVETEDEVVAVVERIIDWIYRRAWSGRLLADQLDELDFDRFKEMMEKEFSTDRGD